MEDEKLFRLALRKAGYHYDPEVSASQQLKECFIDYVDAGYWQNLTLDDIEEISCQEMARALLRGAKSDVRRAEL
ncbi:hypothetical protein CEB3_c17540 [Peptococcaceae bacterium CEB3]|nr:hypothetical protein CEB3_c17540 [Peptococcaceae bacterium CEB3]